MSKRFTATEKWDDPFFQDLSPKYKCFWIFILDKCDAAGVWNVNLRAAEFFIGEKLDMKEVMQLFGDRIKILNGGERWFIQKFIEFQYGELSENCKPHQSVIQILKKYNLYKGYTKGIDTLQEKDKDKEKEKEKEKDKDKEKGGAGENKIFADCVAIYFDYYQDKVGVRPVFSKIEGKNLKYLIKKIQESTRSSGRDPTPEIIVETFKHILIHLPKWYITNGLSLSIINSKYNELIAGIKTNSSNYNEARIIANVAASYGDQS